MKAVSRLVEIIGVAFWLTWAPFAFAEEAPRNWGAIESDILASKILGTASGTFKRDWTNSQRLLSLVADRDASALIRLANVSTNPIVIYSAYYALRQVESVDMALDLGMALALRGDVTNFHPAVALAQVMEDHTNGLSRTLFKAALTRATRLENINIVSAQHLARRLSSELLEDWFEDSSRPSVNIDFEALVTWRLLEKARQNTKPASTKILAAMEGYSRLPGVPRYVFVIWKEPQALAPGFEKLLKMVMEDPGIPDSMISILTRAKRKFITTKIDLTQLRISESRREQIKYSLVEEKDEE
ncbi:MAG: hypothetical protein JNN07_19490 [Verrucomicrobiales bacterium]|nr:hypothetical protein [Verrucomicrobiales bacterium]